ncbi:MAG: transposase [Phormidesmis sp. CAN_BIN44]|nr:transposase [Phormidesmis sp. CAN_BIN44]
MDNDGAVAHSIRLPNNLAKAISDASWSEFTRMLSCGAGRDGKVYQEVDRFFPSSKTRSMCLNRIGSLALEIRSWQCQNCGTKHDQDVDCSSISNPKPINPRQICEGTVIEKSVLF